MCITLTSGTGLFVILWLVGLFWNAAGATTLGLYGTIRWDWVPAFLLGGYWGAHLAIKHAFELVTLLIFTELLVGF